jgi:hypothetical protein
MVKYYKITISLQKDYNYNQMDPGHSLDDFGRSKIYIIDHNSSWKENQRQKRESFWICELQTLHLEGINKKA